MKLTTEEVRGMRAQHWTQIGVLAPEGECKGCDEYRTKYLETGDEMFPRHAVNNRCESGGYPHCTCDACW